MSEYDQDQIEGIYQPKDAVGAAVKATGVTSVAGLFVSTIQNTLSKQNVGAMSVFTRTGGTIAIFGTSYRSLAGSEKRWRGLELFGSGGYRPLEWKKPLANVYV
jgi:hypothetical protein